ncbi:phosphopantetheine-binding protein [Rhodococcus qingshengii]|uniref:phosphopantetheine-binding protein n=1 Tax=Rhodococcus qingshengii TaxID=334542 RepID=UPI0036033B69
MLPALAADLVLLIRAAVCCRDQLVDAKIDDPHTLKSTELPGLFYETEGSRHGLYIESAMLDPRPTRGGRLLTLTDSVSLADMILTTPSLQRETQANGGDSQRLLVQLFRQPAQTCRLTSSGYVIFPDAWIEAATTKLYSEVLHLDSIDHEANVFELGGTSRDLQLLMLSINAIFATRIDPREYFTNSAIAALTAVLKAPRQFQKSELLEKMGKIHG